MDDFNPLAALLKKLVAWLMQQPEWPLLFLADRPTRRKASTAVAKMLTTIPTRGVVAPPPDVSVHRTTAE